MSTAITDTQIAVVDRGGFHESWHTGSAILLAADGSVVESHGDVDARPVLARSSLKPIYAASMLALGVDLADERFLALAAASNGGLPMHQVVAAEMAASLGVTENETLVKFSHMCIGKHLHMRAAARLFDAGQHYADPAHPLQRQLLADLERLAGESTTVTVADGCGAPVHATTLTGFARAFRQLAVDGGDANSEHLLRAGRAMRAHPDIVEAPGKPDTVIGGEFDCIMKSGAEGTVAIAMPDGTTAVAHCYDGARRAAMAAVIDLLTRHGALPTDAASRFSRELELQLPGAQVRSALAD